VDAHRNVGAAALLRVGWFLFLAVHASTDGLFFSLSSLGLLADPASVSPGDPRVPQRWLMHWGYDAAAAPGALHLASTES